MPTWLIYGFTSALLWGTDTIFSKIVTSEKYLKIDASNASLLMLAGIILVFLTFFIIKATGLSLGMKGLGFALIFGLIFYIMFALKSNGVELSFPVISFGLLQGCFWALGMVFTFLAFSSGAEAAKLVPIYNTNTLVAVFLGIFFLHELPMPDERVKVITGAVMIVIGTILISK
ncbi:MAG: GRP family sugar transporter [Candidatus Pacebacteria bacterium]|nr:GRP family sugar transporter [Candidatus Paceibacterota bacterium]MDD4333783.1 GRP family sugar transporter [Candidatus Paceibacterota bacterium]